MFNAFETLRGTRPCGPIPSCRGHEWPNIKNQWDSLLGIEEGEQFVWSDFCQEGQTQVWVVE